VLGYASYSLTKLSMISVPSTKLSTGILNNLPA
jgi:hypothetical protein